MVSRGSNSIKVRGVSVSTYLCDCCSLLTKVADISEVAFHRSGVEISQGLSEGQPVLKLPKSSGVL